MNTQKKALFLIHVFVNPFPVPYAGYQLTDLTMYMNIYLYIYNVVEYLLCV